MALLKSTDGSVLALLIHRRFRIRSPKIHKRFRIGSHKIHRRFRIDPPLVTLNLLLSEFHSQWILVYHGYYARKATKVPIWNRMCNTNSWASGQRMYRTLGLGHSAICRQAQVRTSVRMNSKCLIWGGDLPIFRLSGGSPWTDNSTTALPVMLLDEESDRNRQDPATISCPYWHHYAHCTLRTAHWKLHTENCTLHT